MLPRDEQLALIDTLATAIDRAGEGKLAEGYAALRAGLTRALEQQGRGKPGSAEAVARWCWACEWFSGRYLRCGAVDEPGCGCIGAAGGCCAPLPLCPRAAGIK